MSVIHLTVNECGIELEDNEPEGPLLTRVTGRAHDALLLLRQAIAMIPIDDVAHIHQRAVLSSAAGTLRAAISEVDSR
jgi:hypothetical protein